MINKTEKNKQMISGHGARYKIKAKKLAKVKTSSMKNPWNLKINYKKETKLKILALLLIQNLKVPKINKWKLLNAQNMWG